MTGLVILRLQILKAALCYEIVMLVVHTLCIIENLIKNVRSVFTSSGTNVGGAINIPSNLIFHHEQEPP